MTPSQKLIDAAAEALYDADRKMHPPSRSTWPKWKDAPDDVKGPYRSAVTIPVTVALRAAVEVCKAKAEEQEAKRLALSDGDPDWDVFDLGFFISTLNANAISSLIPAQEKTNDA
jgi:hypothetical protein